MDLIRAHGITAAGADQAIMRRGDAGGGRLAGGQTPVLSASLRKDRAAFGRLLAARVLLFLMLSAMVGDSGAQTLYCWV